jgi:hypothetical protein
LERAGAILSLFIPAVWQEHAKSSSPFSQILWDACVLPKNCPPINADYVFHSERIIAELKCLADDNSDSIKRQEKLNALLDTNFNEGKIKTKILDESTWKDFPLHLQRDIASLFSPSIRARIKKADIQIRETKANCGMNYYSGLLILANDGLVTMPPAAFIEVAMRYITNNLHHIDCFIYLTVNLFTRVEGMAMPVLFWMPMSLQKPSKISDTFLRNLFDNWRSRVDKKWGIKSFRREISDDDMEAFWKARHYPK